MPLSNVVNRDLVQTSARGGISQASKVGQKFSVAWMRSADVRSDPSEIRFLPAAVRDSVTITVPGTTTAIFYPEPAGGSLSTDGFALRQVSTAVTFLLYDNFDDNSIDSVKWTTSGQVEETSGKLRLYARKNSTEYTSQADTDNKTAPIPPGEPVTGFFIRLGGHGPAADGLEFELAVTDGTDKLWFVFGGSTGNMVIRQSGGYYGTTTDLSSQFALPGTITLKQEGSDILCYADNTLVLTLTGKTIRTNSRLQLKAWRSSGSGGSADNYFEVDEVQLLGAASAGESFGTLRGGAGTNAGANDTSGSFVELVEDASANKYDKMGRSVLLFDTSDIPDGAVPSAATLDIFVETKLDDIGSQAIVLVTSTPAGNTTVLAADYAQLGTTANCTAVNLSAITVNQYNSITLNATGLSNINLTGVTKFGLKLEADRGNSAPAFVGSKTTKLTGQFADGANKPRLTVTYAVTSPDELSTRGLVKWIVPGAPYTTSHFWIDDTGTLYERKADGTVTLLKTIANCTGQGLELFNDYLYYVQNAQLGRYGPLSGSPTFTDNFQTGLANIPDFSPVLQSNLDFMALGAGNKVYKIYGTETGGTAAPAASLTLPLGFKVRCLAIIGEYIAVGIWRGTTINDAEVGKIVFWDGTAVAPNFIVDVPEGAVNAMGSLGGTLYYVAGSKGAVLRWSSAPLGRIFQIPKMTVNTYMEVWPGAMTSWQALLHIGAAAVTDNSALEHGVYAYGSLDKFIFPEALTYDYPPSFGTRTGTGIKIGAVKGIGRDLFFSWSDGTNFGVDRVRAGGIPATSATIELLRFDNKDVVKQKKPDRFIQKHSALLSGESITLKYKLDRATSYTSSTTNTTVGSTETIVEIPNDFNEIDLAIDITGGGTMPSLYGNKFEFDDLF